MNHEEAGAAAYLKSFREKARLMVEARQKSDHAMSKEPLEVQLEYYFSYYGWEVIRTLPPDEDETLMYAFVKRGSEPGDYCVPELPGNRELKLISANGNLFIFAVDERQALCYN